VEHSAIYREEYAHEVGFQAGFLLLLITVDNWDKPAPSAGIRGSTKEAVIVMKKNKG
jgi:hypothetical protein